MHSLRRIYTVGSTFACGHGGMLDFKTYLLKSGHIRGHWGGHLGHGGQYTFFGQPHGSDPLFFFLELHEDGEDGVGAGVGY